MVHAFQRLPLLSPAPGTARHIALHRFGEDGARPLVLVQAGLHGDETAAPLVAHHLARLLAAADARGRIAGEILVVPMANPLAADQQLLGRTIGRHAFENGENFNRRFPDLSARAADLVRDLLGADPAENATEFRTALMRALAETRATDEVANLRLTLLQLAIPADLVLDLHAGGEEAPHLAIDGRAWPALQDLAAEIAAVAVLVSDESGAMSFADAVSRPWRQSADAAGPQGLLPADACLAATVNLGCIDPPDDMEAARTAQALYRFLARRGSIRDEVGAAPPLACRPTPLEGVDMVRATAAGIAVFNVQVGDMVQTGDLLAELVDPMSTAPGGGRVRVYSLADGCFFSRRADGLVRPGQVLARIAGDVAMPHGQGSLLAP